MIIMSFPNAEVGLTALGRGLSTFCVTALGRGLSTFCVDLDRLQVGCRSLQTEVLFHMMAPHNLIGL